MFENNSTFKFCAQRGVIYEDPFVDVIAMKNADSCCFLVDHTFFCVLSNLPYLDSFRSSYLACSSSKLILSRIVCQTVSTRWNNMPYTRKNYTGYFCVGTEVSKVL
jgi:hypothetical protein